MTEIMLGINNGFATKRWPEPEEWCRIIKEDLGLNHVQFSFDLLDPRTNPTARSRAVKRIRKMTKEYDLDIHSTLGGLVIYSGNRLLHPDPIMRREATHFYEEAIVVTSELGAKGTGGPLGAFSMKDFRNAKRRQSLTEQLYGTLQYLAELVAREGQDFLLWEPSPLIQEFTPTIGKAKDFFTRANKCSAIPILFCLDCGHQCVMGVQGRDRDPYEWIKEFGSLSPVMHVQQTDGILDRHWPFTKEYNDKGLIRPDKIIKSIQESGAEKVVMFFEVVHPSYETETKILGDLKESVNYWKSFM